MRQHELPKEIELIISRLEKAGFQAYPVGGCVRDLLLGEKPKDWDVTTNALPEEIKKLFPKSFYKNEFYTVTVQTGSPDKTLGEVEVTTYRSEGRYEDKRHPSDIKPAQTLEEDLSRRDFTVNAMALGYDERHATRDTELNSLSRVSCPLSLIDPFDGQKDLAAKRIRAVGNSEERFEEDALRMMRAVRFAVTLNFSASGGSAPGWDIEPKTEAAIKKHAGLLRMISKERVRDELVKIVESGRPMRGFEILERVNLLRYIMPELREGIGVEQNLHHIYTVWEHNLRALQYAADQKFNTTVRLAALLHDVGKPRSKTGTGKNCHFYGHDVVGAKMTLQIMERLRFSKSETEKTAKLVRWHLFDYDIEDEKTTDSAIRRLIRNVGEENIEDLIKVRMCDRIGSGVPKAIPYRLRHFQFRVEKILKEKDAVRVTMLAVNGNEIMDALALSPGPRVGHILNALLEEVLDNPTKNTKEYLLERARKLNRLSDKELVILRENAEKKAHLIEEEKEKTLKKKHHVK